MLLDANALFLPFDRGMGLVDEIERWVPGALIAVPSSALAEVDALAKRSVPHARLARTLADRFPRVATSGRGDTAIVTLAERHGAIVVTADRGLRDRLARAGLAVLAPRDRSRLTLIERRAPRARAATVKNDPPLERPPSRRRPTDAG